AEKGFAINNVILGVGSFSMMCLEEDGNYSPYTRDTFGIAVKATYAEDKNHKPIMIYKAPKALSWKKSQKGCCKVAPDGQSYEDGFTDEELGWEELIDPGCNLLQQIFLDGQLVKEYNLAEVRENMYGEEF
ncbi:MAG: nicotinate phosphoribosyltransferase, partial [Lachnospiraceae bacterium]|nr:nicotinate phosphoribosyltransferase [Lachnospiraceae bacterium]